MSFENPFTSGENKQADTADNKQEIESPQPSLDVLDREVDRSRLRVEIAREIEDRLRDQNVTRVYGATFQTIERDFVVRELVDPRNWPNASRHLQGYLRAALEAGCSLDDARAVYGELIRKYVPEFDIEQVEPE